MIFEVKAAAPLTGSLQRNAALTVFTNACTFTCQKAENRADDQKTENRADGQKAENRAGG